MRWVFGWNQDNRTYFLQKTDKTANPPVTYQWGTRPYEMPDPDGLIFLAKMFGLEISGEQKVILYRYKEFEKATYYVVHYEGDFVNGFPALNEQQANELTKILNEMYPDKKVLTRKVVKKVHD